MTSASVRELNLKSLPNLEAAISAFSESAQKHRIFELHILRILKSNVAVETSEHVADA